MKAVVMAGGEGTRLRPLTSNQPKPMVPIVGKPCMEHIIELLKAHGFEDVIVTVAFLPQSIRSYFGNGESIGANIEYSVEESPAGTAGSVRLASDYLEGALAPEERARLEQHLVICAGCANYIGQTRATVRALGTLGGGEKVAVASREQALDVFRALRKRGGP